MMTSRCPEDGLDPHMCLIDNNHTQMHEVNVRAFDLNLLVALDALLEDRSVTRAARRVGLSQPAMSHALARLRTELGDPVLVRAGRAMRPTPRAERLREPVRRVLADVERALRDEGRFAPATSSRRFSLTCPDLLAPVLPDLLGSMTAQAPGVRLEVFPQPGPDLSLAGDLALGPAGREGTGLMSRTLGRVRWAVVGRRGHPAFRGRLTVAKWTRYPHVQVRTGDGNPSIVGEALARAGVRRTVGLVVPSFLAAPEVVARTDHLFAAVRELVEPVAERLGLALKRPPVALDDVPVAMFWHERMHADDGHRWFRDAVADVIDGLLARPRPP
ncbi:MAG TPA: LysR family transcriptional regulator, partial [Sandaracinaceae bacterium LLY-WYZ-13_1]|nr:LysR family transcriptional regulator [Sandaracinaceae bacterium LLY-WYZ-13_1]